MLPALHCLCTRADNQSSWGGSVLRLPIDGKMSHVMFAAEMTHGCTLAHWTTNSEVVMAVAENPTGPYVPLLHVLFVHPLRFY